MDVTAGVLVIPSQHLEDNPGISTCLSNAVIRKVEGSTKVLPIFTKENISGKVPFGLIDIIGINWDGDTNMEMTVNKSRAITHLHSFVEENTSK